MAIKPTRNVAATLSRMAAPAHLASARLREVMSGVELFRLMAAGALPPPPLVSLLGFRLAEVEEGHIVFAAEPLEAFYNGAGVVHGGWTAALLDSALGCAVNSMMPAGRMFTTLELKVNLIRPLRREVGEIRCDARVLHAGNRTATAEARILDAAGKLYAHGTTTCILVEPPGDSRGSDSRRKLKAAGTTTKPPAGRRRPGSPRQATRSRP